MTEPPGEPPWRDIGAVCIVSLLIFVAFGMLLPVFPLWVENFADSMTGVGFATTFSVGVGLLLARPLAARLMEGRDRRPTLALAAALTALATGLFPFLTSLSQVVFVRGLQGMGFGLLGTAAISLITDLAPLGRRGQVLGYFGAINALSLVIGPVTGAWITRQWSFDVTFFTAAALAATGLLVVGRIAEPPKPTLPAGRRSLFEVLALPSLRVVVLGHLLAILLHGALTAFLPRRFVGYSGHMSVEAFLALDAIAVIAFRLIVGHRFDLWSRHVFVRLGLCCLSAGGLLIAVGGHDLVYAAAGVLYGVGFGSYVPAVNALVGDLVPETHRARGFAVFMLALDLGLALGGLVFGPIVDALGTPAAFAIGGLCPLLALAVHLAGRRRFAVAPA